MNTKRNIEFLEKIIEAKKMEIEAVGLLFPQRTKEHLNIIGKEVKEMIKECICDTCNSEKDCQKNNVHEQKNNGVKKVEIV